MPRINRRELVVLVMDTLRSDPGIPENPSLRVAVAKNSPWAERYNAERQNLANYAVLYLPTGKDPKNPGAIPTVDLLFAAAKQVFVDKGRRAESEDLSLVSQDARGPAAEMILHGYVKGELPSREEVDQRLISFIARPTANLPECVVTGT